ncbi:MAG: hypothetical protein N3A60_09330, partial [Thermanaerothrix sp.]|nr:hypothetical protein [Thermanaerothrix sp.]
VLAFLLILPLGLWAPSYFNFFFWSILGGIGLAAEYLTARTEIHPHWTARAKLLPGMALLGIGISLTCAFGAIDGWLHNGGVFERTPKGLTSTLKNNSSSARTIYNYLEWGEGILSLYLLLAALLLASHAQAGMLPWLFTSFTGFFLISQGAFLEEPIHNSTPLSTTNHHLSSLTK